MKGYELYSWQMQGKWFFALVTGTNRIKTFDEIASSGARISGVDALKSALDQLANGESVYWLTRRVPHVTLPTTDLADEIRTYCSQRGIKLVVETGDSESSNAVEKVPVVTIVVESGSATADTEKTKFRFVPYGIGGDVPVRTAPDADSPVLRTISMGEKYRIIDRAGEWRVDRAGTSGQFYQIQLDDLTTGWVRDMRGGLDGECAPFATPSAPEDEGPRIISFAADAQDGSVHLAWDAVGEYAAICPLIDANSVGCRCLFELPLAGSITIKPSEIIGSYTGFELAVRAGDRSAMASAAADVRCQGYEDWFFADPPRMCPDAPPLFSSAAAQRFQNGMMIWMEALDAFYILFDVDQNLSGNTQGWSSLKSLRIVNRPLEPSTGALPKNREHDTVRRGCFEPVGGFGPILRGEISGTDDLRETLGCAKEPEHTFDTVYQCQVSCGAHWDCYLRGPDGKILHLYYLMHSGRFWEEWPGS
jgi:hypothetical protein